MDLARRAVRLFSLQSRLSVYTVLASVPALLLLIHLVFLRQHHAVGNVCLDGNKPAGKLDRSLLEGLYQLRYQAGVLRAERDQLLNAQLSLTPKEAQQQAAAAAATAEHDVDTTESSNGQQEQQEQQKPSLFLFIAVFSIPSFEDRRAAVRQAWMGDAPRQGSVHCTFVLSGAEKTPAVLQEAEQHRDMLFSTDTLAGYRSIIHKTYFVLQHALEQFDVRFVMKADDDTFVNVPGLLSELRSSCLSSDCRDERIYFGREIRNNVVRVGAGDKWQDLDYLNHTSLKTYMPYMMGGGYVLSSDLAQVILGINHQSHDHNLLKFMPNEDVSIGFWLMSVDVRRIDHQWVVTWGHPCCFERARRQGGGPDENRSWFKVTVDICTDPWIILHKIEHLSGMRYLGQRLRQCGRVTAVKDRARELSVAARAANQPYVEHGKVERITDGSHPGEALLGSYQGSPWSPDGSMILAIKPPPPAKAAGQAAPGLIHIGAFKRTTGGGWHWEQLDTSSAWNSHSGPQLQWLGHSSRYAVFNDRQCGNGQDIATAAAAALQGACTVVYDLQLMTRARVLPYPLAAVSRDGAKAASLDFLRLDVARPGAGYAASAAVVAQIRLNNLPPHDGLWLVDVLTGRRRLLVSLVALHAAVTAGPLAGTRDAVTGLEYHNADEIPASAARGCFHWAAEPQFNPETNRIAFLYRFGHCFHKAGPGVWTFLFTIGTDGTGLWRVPVVQGGAGHDYGGNGRLLVCDSTGVFEVEDRRRVTKLQLPESVTWTFKAGSCQYFLHNERFVLFKSRPAAPAKLFIWDRWNERVHLIGEYTPRPQPHGFQHGGLVPLWSRDGAHVAFDSTHSGQGWHLYLAGVAELGAAMLAPQPQPLDLIRTHPKRYVLLDVGAKRGEVVKRFLQKEPQSSRYFIHAFEANPVYAGSLRSLARKQKLSKRMSIHLQAAWTSSERIGINVEETALSRSDYVSDYHASSFRRIIDAVRHRWQFGKTGVSDGSIVVPTRHASNNITVDAINFSSWLLQNLVPADFVVLHVDINAGEFELLYKMIMDGSILLVDRLCVKWNDVLLTEYAEWPDLYDGIFELLGVAVGHVGSCNAI